MVVNLVIVHKLCHGTAPVRKPVLRELEILAENLHQHGFACSGLAYDQQVLLKNVMQVRKDRLTFPMVVEVQEQEPYHVAICFINHEPLALTA